MVFYRPHETWTTRADWRIQLPAGEDVTCKSNIHQQRLGLMATSDIFKQFVRRSNNFC